MRKLNNKQKKLLDEWFETIQNEPGLAVRDIVQELLPYDLWEKLALINDFETIYQETNYYLNAKVL